MYGGCTEALTVPEGGMDVCVVCASWATGQVEEVEQLCKGCILRERNELIVYNCVQLCISLLL